MNASVPPGCPRRFNLPSRSVNEGWTEMMMSQGSAATFSMLRRQRSTIGGWPAPPVKRSQERTPGRGCRRRPATGSESPHTTARTRPCSPCVSWSEVRRDRQRADAQNLAVLDDTNGFDRWIRIDGAAEAELGIVGGRLALLDRTRAGSAGGDGGAADPLKRSDAAGVIVVRVRVHDETHVLRAEPKLADGASIGAADCGRPPSRRTWPASAETRIAETPAWPT